jgi:hypothetical protein
MRYPKFTHLGLAIVFGGIIVGVPHVGATKAPQASAVLRGKILFEGDAPPRRTIEMRADPYCQQFTAATDEVRVSDGGLENVMVYVTSIVEGNFPPPSEVVLLDSRECQYQPHVLTLQVGQRLVIRNSDETAQNVHIWSTINRPSNESMSRSGVAIEKTFDKAEIPIPIRSDIHNWEVAWLGVFDHPYHTISKSGGAYELHLPPGEYRITAWHERYGAAQQTVRVAASDNAPLNFVFKQR